MDNAAGESDSCAALRWRRPARRGKDAASCESAAYVSSRAPYRKNVCEAASTPLSTPQRLPSPHNVSISAPLLHPTPCAGFSVLPTAPAVSVAHSPPTNPPAVSTTISLSPGASFACPTSSLPSHTACKVVDALRLQVEQSVRRARNAEENERQLRLALHEVETNQEAVIRALQEYRHLKIPEGNKLLRERVRQLEAENASLRAVIHYKETELSRKDTGTEKLSQHLFDVSCTLEGIQKKHLTLLQPVHEAELSAAGTGMRFSATSGETLLSAPCDAAEKRKETHSSFPAYSPECGDLGNAQQVGEYGQAGEEGVRLAEIAHNSSAKCPRSPATRRNRTGSCSHCNSVEKGRSDEAICAIKASHATLASSPKCSRETAQLQEENAVLKKALLEASAAVDESGALLREKEGSMEKLRKHEEHVEQLQLKENESKQLLQKREQEIRHLHETLLQQELAKASADQVSAKLNARVTALLLQVRQTDIRCEEMEGAYKAKIRSLEERLATYSPPVCLEAQTQTTHLSSSPSPLREFLELNTERFSLLAFDMKKRLVASEQEKNDKLLEHERLVEEKELHLSETSARFAAATEEHAAEKKKLHAKVVELEGELALCRTKHQTTIRMLQKARRRLDDGRIKQQALAREKQQEVDAHQRVVSSLEVRFQAEKEKLKEALCSMDVTQRHLRRLLQHRKVSATSTQTSQTEDIHSIILEVPAEFQEQFDLLSAPHSPDTRHTPLYRDGSLQQRKNKSSRKEAGENFALQSISLQCTNRICTQFAVDANERICMLTAALLCKTHKLAIADERLTLLRRVSKTNYSLTTQLSEERSARLETCRRLSRAEIEWRERVSFLEKQNERLLQDKKEAVEKVELLHASESKVQRESLLLREEHGLCRKQLEELHLEHTNRASQERREHERLLQILKHYLKERLASNCRLQPSTFSSEGRTHMSCGLAQAVEHSAAKSPKGLQNVYTKGRIPLSSHSRALEGSAYAADTDLVGAIQQLTTAATRLFACLEKAQSVRASTAFSTTRCCSSPSTSACRCMASICVKDECIPGYSVSTGSEWKQSMKKGSSDHGITCRSKTIRLCSSAPHACDINSYSPRRREGVLDEIQGAVPREPLIQHRRTRATQYVEQALEKATSRISNTTNLDTMEKASVQNPVHTCNRSAAFVEEGDEAQQQVEGYHRCTKVDIVHPGVNRAAHQSAVSAEVKELLDQLYDLFLCAGQRLADTEQTAAINEIVSALTYKQWQLQKVREAELLRDRALLRHQLQVLKHQLFASQAAGDRLDSGLCKLYRERCEEIEKQLLVAIRQLRIHENERKHLIGNLRDAQQQAEALQRRLTWTEVRKKEMELLVESTAEERIMQRLITFKEEVLESLQTESNHVALVSPSLVCNGETEANEESSEKLSQLSQQVTQERRERAALHFALREMQQENKMMLHLLDQKEKQLALMQEMKLPRPADIATTVENTQERRRVQADFTMQKKISPRASGGGTPQPTASSTAITSACLRLLDMETFPSSDNGVDASQLLGGFSHLKGIVHQQQVEMLKQAEKLSCCEIEVANLRSRNGSLSNELSRHLSKLIEAQAALEDSARVRARMEDVELWASRLRQAHQAELNSMRYAQKCRLQQISVEWEEKTNKVLNALHAENANLKTVTQQLCTDTEALRQQLWRHKEALQRHNVLDELSQAGFGALHTFQLETSLQKTKGTAQKTVVANRRTAAPQILMQHTKHHGISPGLPPEVSQSAFRLGVRMNNNPDQRLKNAVPSTVVKSLLQAFVQLCIQLAECERQLLRDFDSSTSASSKRPSSSEAERVSPQPLRLRVLQHPSRETSVLRGQRIVIRWLYACSVNRLEDSPCAPALASSNITEVLHPPNASTAGDKTGGQIITEEAVDTMLPALLSAEQSSQPRPAARNLPPQQRRALLHLKEGARELVAVLTQTCQSVITTRCAQQLIVERLTGIERELRLMRRIVGTKHKAERKNSLSKIDLDAGSTESVHRLESRKSGRSSEYSGNRYNRQLYRYSDGITNDGERSRLPSRKYYPFCALKRGRASASKRIVPEAQFVLARRAFACSLNETEQLLQLVCSCAEECSSIMQKAILAAEKLSAKLGAIFFSQTRFRLPFLGQADNMGGTAYAGQKNFQQQDSAYASALVAVVLPKLF